MRRTLQGLTLLVPLVLVWGAIPAWAESRPDDPTIKYWVSEALRQDPRVESSHINVASSDGVVTLTGQVRNLAAKGYADNETKKITGVLGVINELEVKPVYRYDADIASDVRWRLMDSPSMKLHQLDVEVYDGIVTLRGEVASWPETQEAQLLASEVQGVREVHNELTIQYAAQRPDDAIRQDVLASINRDVYLVGLPINVAVKDGVVTLSGSVGNRYEWDRAINAAWVGSVKSVKNDLKVEWWENRGVRRKYPLPSDAELKQAVKEELYKDLRVEDPFEIEVDCSYGHVTLHGSVPTYYQKELAARDTKNIVGVGWVTDELMVKANWRDDAAIRRDVEARFDSDYLINGQDIQVRVKDGVVNLYGNTNTYNEASHAVDVASRIPGVVNVVDNVHVNWFFRYTDAKLQQRIKDRLYEHDETRAAADSIKVSVTDGIVTLTGDVPLWSERKEAGEVAFLTEGVRGVDNRLTVEGVSYPWDEWHYPPLAIGQQESSYEP